MRAGAAAAAGGPARRVGGCGPEAAAAAGPGRLPAAGPAAAASALPRFPTPRAVGWEVAAPGSRGEGPGPRGRGGRPAGEGEPAPGRKCERPGGAQCVSSPLRAATAGEPSGTAGRRGAGPGGPPPRPQERSGPGRSPGVWVPLSSPRSSEVPDGPARWVQPGASRGAGTVRGVAGDPGGSWGSERGAGGKAPGEVEQLLGEAGRMEGPRGAAEEEEEAQAWGDPRTPPRGWRRMPTLGRGAGLKAGRALSVLHPGGPAHRAADAAVGFDQHRVWEKLLESVAGSQRFPPPPENGFVHFCIKYLCVSRYKMFL